MVVRGQGNEAKKMRAATVTLMGMLLSGCSAVAEPEPVGVMHMSLLCIDAKSAERTLVNVHKETPKMLGVTKDESAMMELWTDGKGDAWTLILHRTKPVHSRCMVFSGQGIVDTKNFIETGLAR